MDPDTIGIGIEDSLDVPTGVYYSVGNGRGARSLSQSFNGKDANGNWEFVVENEQQCTDLGFPVDYGTGDLYSIELTFECEEE